MQLFIYVEEHTSSNDVLMYNEQLIILSKVH